MKRLLRQGVILLLLFTVILTGCGSTSNSSEDLALSDVTNEMAETGIRSENAQASLDQANEERVNEEAAALQESNENVTGDIELEERKVIYNAYISMEVKSFRETRDNIESRVTQLDGYIVQTSQNESEQDIGGHLTVRVPEDVFSDFLDDVEKLADKLLQREVTGSDVTEEYVDLESRLKAKQAVEERLLAFMEDAQETEDLLKISQDLSNVQEEIEQLTGRIKYLDNQVAYATVNINITQPLVNRGITGEDERNTLAAAWHALIASTNGLLNLFSGLFVFLAGAMPVLIILTVIAVPLWIWWRKKGRHIVTARRNNDDSSN